jgi:hypothetical protein
MRPLNLFDLPNTSSRPGPGVDSDPNKNGKQKIFLERKTRPARKADSLAANY